MAFLIDIEGIDGSGKGTQAALLTEYLQQQGYRTRLISFPRYGKTLFARGIADFLNGRYGALDEVNPFLVSLLYSGDRFESRAWLLDQLASEQVLVLDRYVPSNLAHQGSKCRGSEREELIRWIEQIEYEVYALPRPDLVLWLDLPVPIAHERIAAKKPREYTSQTTDLQEADSNHLLRTREVYESLAQSRREWHTIPAFEGACPLSAVEMSQRIRRIVEPIFQKSIAPQK